MISCLSLLYGFIIFSLSPTVYHIDSCDISCEILYGFKIFAFLHILSHYLLDMAKRVRPVWPATRLTHNPINLFKNNPFWPVTRLTRDPIDPTRTRPDLPVLPCLPMMSKLRLRCNFYKIFTYSSLLNMLCTLL